MPKILVWKCATTGKLFEDEKKYKSHLARLACERRERRKLQIEEDAAQAWWDEVQNREMDIKDLPKFIIENQNRFWADAAQSEPWRWDQIGKTRRGVVMPMPELVDFTTFSLTWSNSVRNTHRCPKNGVTNWGGQTKLADGSPAPRGYPGWCGRIDWRVRCPGEGRGHYLGGELFGGHRSRIHIGTGGGGGWKNGLQSFGYGVEIFAADWPGLARFHEKQFVWKTLGGDPRQVKVLA